MFFQTFSKSVEFDTQKNKDNPYVSKFFVLKFHHSIKGEEKIEIDMTKYLPAKKDGVTMQRDLKNLNGIYNGKKIFFFVDVLYVF